MNIIVCDMEVFAFDWLYIGKDLATGKYTVIHNDNAALKEVVTSDSDVIFAGFNMKHYDSHIIKAVCCGADNKLVKEINDYIIRGGRGWEHPFIRENYLWFNTTDIKDDMQQGLSLKAIEGHLFMSVEESPIPFDLDRPLTEAELTETIQYCMHDVDTTAKLITIRKDYLNGKLSLGRLKGIEDSKALYMTNAKLTAAYLDAVAQEHADERDYQYPENLKREFVPPEVFEFFDRMHDSSLSDDELFKSKIRFKLAECPCVVGFGGIHGAKPFYMEEAHGTRTIRNFDVASLYPSLMINCGYTSRNIPSPEHFREVYTTRLNAKRSGDKTTSATLKLVLNTTYGAMLNKYNALFDPRMGRSVCASGQLFLLELAAQYVAACPSLTLIQLNTDGIMVSVEEAELPALAAVNDEWQTRTGFILEEDVISKIVQKDVNNYIEIQDNGDVKLKGGYLVRGEISDHSDPLSGKSGGAWNINNNARIVAMAIKEYFMHGTAPEDTILACDDIFQFQLIAKAGVKYKEAYHEVDGERLPVQKVNRVYATKDTRYGKLFKVKTEDDATAKIEMLPEHCIIDNGNRLTIADIDKEFYIGMAQKRINDFLGIKPEKIKKERKPKMATAKKAENAATEPAENFATLNVWQKLLRARVMFLDSNVKKTGKNMHLSIKYFELDDIVPVATRIFDTLGLLALTTYSNEAATMTIINTDTPEQSIVFTSPMREIDSIESNRTGGKLTNAVQNLGSVETYQRRYLYMTALDICEQDTLDPQLGEGAAPAAKPPVTPEKREEVAKSLANANGNASSLQIRQLKDALKKLRAADPSKEEMVANIAVQTEGFTQISKTDCEKLIIKISEMITGTEEENGVE